MHISIRDANRFQSNLSPICLGLGWIQLNELSFKLVFNFLNLDRVGVRFRIFFVFKF